VTFYFDVFTQEMLTHRCAERRGDRKQYIDGFEDVKLLLKGQTEPVYLHTDQGSVYSSIAYNERSAPANQVKSPPTWCIRSRPYLCTEKRATREVLKWALGAKLHEIVIFMSDFYVCEHKRGKKV
jgi:hypothetical protein